MLSEALGVDRALEDFARSHYQAAQHRGSRARENLRRGTVGYEADRDGSRAKTVPPKGLP